VEKVEKRERSKSERGEKFFCSGGCFVKKHGEEIQEGLLE
jgi:hypothetical protein